MSNLSTPRLGGHAPDTGPCDYQLLRAAVVALCTAQLVRIGAFTIKKARRR